MSGRPGGFSTMGPEGLGCALVLHVVAWALAAAGVAALITWLVVRHHS